MAEAADSFTGRCVAVLHRLDDEHDKLVVVSESLALSDDEVRGLAHFEERWFSSVVLHR